jgi:hypothetical protein
MTKAVWTGAVTAAAIVLLSSPAFAQQTAGATVSVNVNVNARAKLTLGTATIDFLDADPDLSTTLVSAPFAVDVKARTTRLGTVRLDVSAPDFTGGGGSTIAIGNLSYGASGTGFTATAPFTTAAAQAGTWTGSGNQGGTHTYTLANLWAYNTGIYGTTVTYTLTAP